MGIPFVDLKAQYRTIKHEIDHAISEVLESTYFVGGEKLETFERHFAEYSEAGHAVGTSSGTSALHLALHALGIGRGDEVITATNTFIATTEAISQTGASPILVDVDDKTLNLDPEKTEAAITPRTKAIVPVHLYGQSADMDAIRTVASRRSLKVIVDACQAHGAKFNGSRKAIQGDVTCFSFYPGKNLGAYGDGGMVITDDGDLADKMRRLGNHGRLDRYTHFQEGFNYRLDAIQAAILDVKLRHLDEWNEKRRSRAKRYERAFSGGLVRPVGEVPGRYHVYHLYVVRTRERDRLLDGLGKRGISAGIHYPVPLHLQAAYKHLGLGRGTFPVAEKATDEIVSLPMYPELSDEMIDQVVGATKEILG
jgi:dTDP-4-amino-4,6-dideoxygalactose transaminase